jgi:hypothetical protein
MISAGGGFVEVSKVPVTGAAAAQLSMTHSEPKLADMPEPQVQEPAPSAVEPLGQTVD